jgi:hypothetical protein
MSQIPRATARRNSQRRLAALIAREITVVLRQYQEQRIANPPPPFIVEPTVSHYTIKNFTICKPPKYSGQTGATALLQWFERIESIFSLTECPAHLQVKYAASVFTKRALTWWNQEKLTRGMEAAHALAWADLKTLMLAEFCPRNEVKKLESEFWELKQESGNNAEYTTRFHELSLLVPRMVNPVSVAIEKYIDGLPPKIRDIVLSSKPSNLAEAVRLAASLTDNLVKDGELVREKKKVRKGNKEPVTKKRKTEPIRNFAATTPKPSQPYHPPNHGYQNQPRKPYLGPYPLCVICGYHHPANLVCRFCSNCNRFGHWIETCRSNPTPIFAPIPLNVIYPNQAQEDDEGANCL